METTSTGGNARQSVKTRRERVYLRFTPERNRDFLNICRHIINTTDRPLTRRQLVEQALSYPAPGYYADFDYALHIVPRIMKMPTAMAARRGNGKWLEIGQRAESLVRTGESPNMTRAIQTVLTQGIASRFFIGVETGIRILNDCD